MKETGTKEVSATLAESELHAQWESDYRAHDNADFYQEHFDYISRVLKACGWMILSETNMKSFQSVLIRTAKMLFGKKETEVLQRTEAGLEYWAETPAGALLSRQADVGWLKGLFEDTGMILEHHTAGQFAELYTRFSSPLARRLIHGPNRTWLRHVRFRSPAFENLLLLKKSESQIRQHAPIIRVGAGVRTTDLGPC